MSLRKSLEKQILRLAQEDKHFVVNFSYRTLGNL